MAEGWFAPEDKPALADFWQVYDAHFVEISQSVRSAFSQMIVNATTHAERKVALRAAIVEGGWHAHEARLRGIAVNAYDNGVPFASWHELYEDFTNAIVPRVVGALKTEPERLAAAIIVIQKYIACTLRVLGEEYLAIQTRALAANEKRYHLLFDRSPLPMWVYDPGTLAFVAVNDAAVHHYGYSREEFSRLTLADIRPPEDVKALRDDVAQRGQGVTTRTWRHLRKNGELIQVEIWSNDFAIEQREMRLIVVLDITERKALEEQFRQTQKMEAVGKLAGGIAHDFNNLLSVILSYSSLALRGLRPDDPLYTDLEEIERAGERAATLTRQLLAFSRQQMLRPVLLDLNTTVSELQKMLQRLIGEDVQLTTRLAADLDLIRADPGQIDQVILNLVVNARDAMPKGGAIILETANVELDEDYVRAHVGAEAGPHVMLAVSDNGTGIDKATQARVFEPFFTTKATGQGTGLGLATVFGIVKQSGGSIYLYSEVGRGTTFKIYLPRECGIPETQKKAARIPPLGGSETILLVEDEAQVRKLAHDVLTRAGYTVIEALTPTDAVRIGEGMQPFALLLTDVVMPEMNGEALAQRMRALRPSVKVLFMSGYTAGAIVHNGALGDGAVLLQKPLTPDALLRHVRRVLDAD